jgi:hypothetical protein
MYDEVEPWGGIIIHPTYLAKLELILPLFDKLSEDDQRMLITIVRTWLGGGGHDYNTIPLYYDAPTEAPHVHILGRKAIGE